MHPDNYEQTEKLLKTAGFDKEDLRKKEKLQEIQEKLKGTAQPHCVQSSLYTDHKGQGILQAPE